MPIPGSRHISDAFPGSRHMTNTLLKALPSLRALGPCGGGKALEGGSGWGYSMAPRLNRLILLVYMSTNNPLHRVVH
eukprot:scaffold112521_cov23-Tisochrysis_lutea.AAC.1